MDRITLGEKTFVKANKIAIDLGYTADYIGQLCRSGKVNAQLVGRTWYVEESSIKEHKKSRYRSVKALAQKEIRQQVAKAPEGEVVAVRRLDSQEPKFAQHRHSTIVTPRYVMDDAELLPTLQEKAPAALSPQQKRGNLKVGLADAEAIEIGSDSVKTEFEASELPKIRFKGTLAVASADDDMEPSEAEIEQSDAVIEDIAVEAPVNEPEAEIEPQTASLDAVELDVIADDKNRSFAVEIDTLKKERARRKSAQSKEHIPVTEAEGSVDTVLPIQRGTESAAKETSIEDEAPEEIVHHTFLTLVLLALLLVAFGIFLLSLTQQIIVDDTSITNGYVLDIRATMSELYVYIKAFLG